MTEFNLSSTFALVILFTPISGNAKTGPISVSTSSKITCPNACPLKAKGCYAAAGALNIHWTRVTKGLTGENWNSFLSKVKGMRFNQLWRHNQSGDLQGANDKLDRKRLRELTAANRNKRAICYTHYSPLSEQVGKVKAKHNRAAIKEAVDNGFVINLSGNNVAHADKLFKLGIAPVVAIVPSEQEKNFLTAAGNRVVICPANPTKGINCSVCGLCARAKRDYIIGFKAHGAAKKSVDEMARVNFVKLAA